MIDEIRWASCGQVLKPGDGCTGDLYSFLSTSVYVCNFEKVKQQEGKTDKETKGLGLLGPVFEIVCAIHCVNTGKSFPISMSSSIK